MAVKFNTVEKKPLVLEKTGIYGDALSLHLGLDEFYFDQLWAKEVLGPFITRQLPLNQTMQFVLQRMATSI